MSCDPTENVRKQLLADINAAPGSREYLKHKHGEILGYIRVVP